MRRRAGAGGPKNIVAQGEMTIPQAQSLFSSSSKCLDHLAFSFNDCSIEAENHQSSFEVSAMSSRKSWGVFWLNTAPTASVRTALIAGELNPFGQASYNPAADPFGEDTNVQTRVNNKISWAP